jgi:hypothetical protein
MVVEGTTAQVLVQVSADAPAQEGDIDKAGGVEAEDERRLLHARRIGMACIIELRAVEGAWREPQGIGRGKRIHAVVHDRIATVIAGRGADVSSTWPDGNPEPVAQRDVRGEVYCRVEFVEVLTRRKVAVISG